MPTTPQTSNFKFLGFQGMLNAGTGDFLKYVYELSACKNIQEDRVGILKRVPGYEKVKKNATEYASRVNGQVTNVNFLHYYFQASTNTKYLLAGSNDGSDYTIRYRTTDDWRPLTTKAQSASSSISSSRSTSPSSSPSSSGSFSPSTSISVSSSVSSSASPSSPVASAGTYTGRANAELSAVNYLDKAFIVGYDATDREYLAPATINGIEFTTSSATDADLTDMPSGRFLVRYRDLLYVLYAKVSTTIYPSRAYYNDDPVSMAIPSWSVATNFVEFGQDDGDEITGGAEAYDRLIVFKTNSMWSYDETNKRKIADIGCDSYKTIKVVNGVLYWANRNGMWRWAGDLPQLISGKVQPFIEAADQSLLGNWVASNQGFEYRLYIGDVTVDGISYTKTWICFDVRRERFYIRCTIHKPLSSTQYIENGEERIHFGSDTGYVYRQSLFVDNINKDDGKEIDYFFITNYLDLGAPHIVKSSPSIYLFSKNCAGMKYSIDVDRNGTFNEWNGEIEENIDEDEPSVKGNRIAFKFYGKSGEKPFEFEGFSIDAMGIENID